MKTQAKTKSVLNDVKVKLAGLPVHERELLRHLGLTIDRKHELREAFLHQLEEAEVNLGFMRACAKAPETQELRWGEPREQILWGATSAVKKIEAATEGLRERARALDDQSKRVAEAGRVIWALDSMSPDGIEILKWLEARS